MIHTLSTSGNYVLGFRVDPMERLDQLYKELKSLYAIYSETPVFGVFYEPKEVIPPKKKKSFHNFFVQNEIFPIGIFEPAGNANIV